MQQMLAQRLETNVATTLFFGPMKKESVRNFVAIAVELAGGEQRCANKMGVTRQAVSKWKNKEEREPGYFKTVAHEYVMGLARVSGIPPWTLTGCPPDPRFHKEDLPVPNGNSNKH